MIISIISFWFSES